MDKKDIMYVAIALGIILVIALVIKPLMTGQPVNTGIPVSPTLQIEETAIIPELNSSATLAAITVTPTPTLLHTPTPQPTWDRNPATVEFVDPSKYGITLNQSLPGSTRIENIPVNSSTTIYSTIKGKYSGTTDIFSLPFPYWELWYTVSPSSLPMGKEQKPGSKTITVPTNAPVSSSGSSQTFIQGSFSVVNPVFTVQVMDGNDPNRIVRTISPPGGLDKSLWVSKTVDGNLVSSDPRPWKEKFYEGQRNYFFVINAQNLDSYTIEIRVPTSYIGKY
jgi:hypothetical protein